MYICPKKMYICPKNMYICPKNMYICPKNMYICPKNMYICPKNMYICPKNILVPNTLTWSVTELEILFSRQRHVHVFFCLELEGHLLSKHTTADELKTLI
eukprot:GHVP01035559.1.p1 GENE.GHVP01035559.1~~GHVP01035559.1.p1  ORF type:complete len:100 (-),score=0.88 GHVP01035559.1:387-686(-)